MASIIYLIAVVSLLSIAVAQQEPPPQGNIPPPPFLEGAPEPLIQEFHTMLSSSGQKTDQQIEEMVKQWVSKQSDDIKTKFAQFEEEKKKSEKAQEEAHQKAIEKFSPDAKEADAKLSAIAKDGSLPAQDKAKKINDLVQGLKPEVRDEIEKAMQQA